MGAFLGKTLGAGFGKAFGACPPDCPTAWLMACTDGCAAAPVPVAGFACVALAGFAPVFAAVLQAAFEAAFDADAVFVALGAFFALMVVALRASLSM